MTGMPALMRIEEGGIDRRPAQAQSSRRESARGRLLVASCRSGDALAAQVVERYSAGRQDEVLYLHSIDRQFSDGETCVRLASDVSGGDAFLFQALRDPSSQRSIDQNYMAFLMAARALREWGANHVTGILPYLTYARQDKPTPGMREPVTARLLADLSVEAGLDRIITWHPHSAPIKGFYGRTPLDVLDPTGLFAEEFRRMRGRTDVIVVAPDSGAEKLVAAVSASLGLTCAVASKCRPRPEEAVITEMIGDFTGKTTAIVLDDIISTGGSVEALVTKLVEAKGITDVYLAVSHNLCMNAARERLQALHHSMGLREVMVTNSVPQTPEFQALPFVVERSLSDTLNSVISRIHDQRALGDPGSPVDGDD